MKKVKRLTQPTEPVIEQGIPGPGRGRKVGKMASMEDPRKKPIAYPTMYMAEAAAAQLAANDRTNRKLPIKIKADRAMKKTERNKKAKHLPLI